MCMLFSSRLFFFFFCCSFTSGTYEMQPKWHIVICDSGLIVDSWYLLCYNSLLYYPVLCVNKAYLISYLILFATSHKVAWPTGVTRPSRVMPMFWKKVVTTALQYATQPILRNRMVWLSYGTHVCVMVCTSNLLTSTNNTWLIWCDMKGKFSALGCILSDWLRLCVMKTALHDPRDLFRILGFHKNFFLKRWQTQVFSFLRMRDVEVSDTEKRWTCRKKNRKEGGYHGKIFLQTFDLERW